MRWFVFLVGLLLAGGTAAAQSAPDASGTANGVTILRGNSAPPPAQQQTVIVQPTTIVQQPIVQNPMLPAYTIMPFYFFPVSPLLHHRGR